MAMKHLTIEKIRNIGLIAHIDAGKTTTTERILYYTGRIHRLGEVNEGTTVMDWMDQERERGITITSAATTCHWQDCQINIIDTPGHVDFTMEVERALRVLDGAIVIFDAVNGVEPQSETVWHQADRYHVPRIVFINKMDRVGADFDDTISQINKRLSVTPLILQLPVVEDSEFKGVIDILREKYYYWDEEKGKHYKTLDIPEGSRGIVARHREKLLEQLSEIDETIMDKFVHGKQPGIDEIQGGIRKATLSSKYSPIFCGSAFKNKGIQPLLDGVINYLPSPVDLPPVKGVNPDTTKEETRNNQPDEKFCAFAFKVQADPYVGRLVFVRIYSGKLISGGAVYNTRKRSMERISRLLRMHANKREEIKDAHCGDIVGVVGLKSTITGDTLSEKKHPLLLESMYFPEPVIWVAIEPKSKADQEKLAYALSRILEEDPTFRVRTDEETNQTIISGMGELHLEIIVDRIKREFNVSASVGRPQVAYKETITKSVSGVGRYIKQTGGRGQYGHVEIQVEPIEGVFEFIDETRGGSIPRDFIPAIERGVKSALETGPLAGYPMVNVRVKLIDGSYHEVDSSDIAFKMAAGIAVDETTRKAGPILLEPIMKVEVVTDETSLGEIISDINARRGRIVTMDMRGKRYHVHTFVPLAEMSGYATTLRSLSQGRASYNMEPAKYEPLPGNIAEALLPKAMV